MEEIKPKISEIIVEPIKIYTNEQFRIKVRVSGILRTNKYKDYTHEKYIDFKNQKYKDIKKWEVI